MLAWRFPCSACKGNCTRLLLKKTWLAGDTRVDVVIGMAVDVSFDFGLARARGQQDCLQHHENLLRAKRDSDGPRFHPPTEGRSEFPLHRLDTRTSRLPTSNRVVLGGADAIPQ